MIVDGLDGPSSASVPVIVDGPSLAIIPLDGRSLSFMEERM